MSSSPSRNWAGITIVVLVALLAFSVIGYFFFPFATFTEQRDAGADIVEQQNDAENALDNYRWFRSQWFDIQAQREETENYYDEQERFLETYGNDSSQWSRQNEITYDRINQRITGSQNQLENLVAEYNARSSDATRAVFKCNLPYQVDDRFAIAGPPGSEAPEQPNDQYVDGANPGAEPPQAQQCDSLPSAASAE